jgi:cephalosporin hydroxylase
VELLRERQAALPIEKNPLDLWMMQQIIYETQPEFVVETGTFKAGSALYWAYTLNGMGLDNSRVFTMDVQDITGTAATNPLWKKYVTFLKGSSTSPEGVNEIGRRVQ